MLSELRKTELALARAAERRNRSSSPAADARYFARVNSITSEQAIAQVIALAEKYPGEDLSKIITKISTGLILGKPYSMPDTKVAMSAAEKTLDLIAKSAVKPAPVNPLAKGQEAIAKRNAATAAVIAKPGPAAGAVGVHELSVQALGTHTTP